jgi:cystathionine gamma-synthase
LKIETLAVHAARRPDPTTGAVVPPIQLATTFARNPDGELTGKYSYIRSQNPNRDDLEHAIAALEGGERAAVFASGIAALHAALQLLEPGDHVIAPTDVYHGTADLMREMQRWGLETSFADVYSPAAFAQALQPNTKLVLLETPSNPMLKISDLAAICDIAHRGGARVVVDNTWATPVLQRPFKLGADLVMHSTTKYFGGHSDVLGGALVSRFDDEFFSRVPHLQTTTGAVPAPFDCWLIRRGLTTLPVRIRTQSRSAMQLAEYLSEHPRIAAVHYPGLESHPGHEVATQQMRGFGAMLSIQVAGGEPAAARAAGRVQIFTVATSLGAVESLIEHRYVVEGPHSQTPKNLLRISIGLENPLDLIDDLDQALAG